MQLLFVAFDGLDPDLIRHCPTFSQFEDRICYLCSVKSTSSPIAWASMYTGRRPEEHGVVPLSRDPDGVSTLKGVKVVPLSRDPVGVSTLKGMKVETFFEVLAAEGFQLGCIGMPMTYPVKKLDRFMVAGFPLVLPRYRNDEEYFYPSPIKPIIDAHYCAYLGANTSKPMDKDDVTTAIVRRSIEEEGEKIRCLHEIIGVLGGYDLDFLAIGFQFTDIAAHCRALYPLEETYAAADRYFAMILSQFDWENLIVVSDHGLPMVPWRGEPFEGYTGAPHRRYGTFIYEGAELEKVVPQFLQRPSSGDILRQVERLARELLGRQGGNPPPPGQWLDITQVCPIVLKLFDIHRQTQVLETPELYSKEEEESIRKQLELLGYL